MLILHTPYRTFILLLLSGDLQHIDAETKKGIQGLGNGLLSLVS